MPKILVSDFDETLYTSIKELNNNIEKIKQFINNGNIFIIATGRSYVNIFKCIEKHKIPFSYLICNDGGTIFDSDFKLIYRNDIPNDIVEKIYKYLFENNILKITYFDTGFDFIKVPSKNINSIIINDINRQKSIEVLNDITSKFPLIHGYISKFWINITSKEVTKSNGIKKILEINNYNKNDVYTIGDTINDISMIKEYNGACMNHSTKDVKEICSLTFNSVLEYIDYIENKTE